MIDGVVIDELVLRVGGIDEARGEWIAREVSVALRDRLAGSGRTGRVDLARVDIRITESVSLDRLPAVIADRIWEMIA